MIGVFDSGYGGLSVFEKLTIHFPELDFVYLGDNGRAPYGSRSPEIITAYTKEAIDWFSKQGASLVILACNTASSQALLHLEPSWLAERKLLGKVLGVVEPVVQAIREKGVGPIGIIGTKATIRSGIYSKSLRAGDSTLSVIEEATPLLVPFIEEGLTEGPIIEALLRSYLASLQAQGIKTLVLGCTHYHFLKKVIRAIAPQLSIIDASSVMPSYLESFLEHSPEIMESIGKRGTRTFFTTDEKDDFARFVERHLNIEIEPIRISL